MTDLVLISLERWDDVWRRNQHLVAGLLEADRRLRVLFVEPPVDPAHSVLRGVSPRFGRGLRRGPELSGVEAGRLWLLEATKLMPRRLDGGYDRRRGAEIASAAAKLGMDVPVLWVNDPAGAVLAALTGWPTLYDVTDDWLEAARPDAESRRLREWEDVLLGCATEVVVCSAALAVSKGRARPVTLVPNAVRVEQYWTVAQRPVDLPHPPVALYSGTLHRDRLDIGLAVRTSEILQRRGSLVMIGPQLLDRADAARLVAAGVRLLGPRRSDAVAAYHQHADVLVVPHVVTRFTDSLDPIKSYEYRAARRPVVSTPVAGFRDARDPAVTVADASTFPDAVERRLQSTPPPRPLLRDTPGVPSWHDRVTQLRSVLGRIESRAAGDRR